MDILCYLGISLAISVYFRTSQAILAISGYHWLSLAIYGSPWLFYYINSYLGVSRVISCFPVPFLTISGYVMLSQAVLGFHGYFGLPLATFGYLWLPWAISDYLGLYRAISGYPLPMSSYLKKSLTISGYHVTGFLVLSRAMLGYLGLSRAISGYP